MLLRVRGPLGDELEVAAVIDTGSTGSLTLPASVLASLGLARRSGGRAVLADGSVRRFDTFAAEILWGGSWLGVVASAVGDESLLGMSLLAGRGLWVEAVPGGAVAGAAVGNRAYLTTHCVGTCRRVGFWQHQHRWSAAGPLNSSFGVRRRRCSSPSVRSRGGAQGSLATWLEVIEAFDLRPIESCEVANPFTEEPTTLDTPLELAALVIDEGPAGVVRWCSLGEGLDIFGETSAMTRLAEAIAAGSVASSYLTGLAIRASDVGRVETYSSRNLLISRRHRGGIYGQGDQTRSVDELTAERRDQYVRFRSTASSRIAATVYCPKVQSPRPAKRNHVLIL